MYSLQAAPTHTIHCTLYNAVYIFVPYRTPPPLVYLLHYIKCTHMYRLQAAPTHTVHCVHLLPVHNASPSSCTSPLLHKVYTHVQTTSCSHAYCTLYTYPSRTQRLPLVPPVHLSVRDSPGRPLDVASDVYPLYDTRGGGVTCSGSLYSTSNTVVSPTLLCHT